MQAIIQQRYGLADVLDLRHDLDKPVPNADEVLVRVHAAGVDRALPLSPFVRQRLRSMFSAARKEDLQFLEGLVEGGKVKPVLDRTPDAHGFGSERPGLEGMRSALDPSVHHHVQPVTHGPRARH